MPKYHISVSVEYTGTEYYEVEAVDEADALAIARAGKCEPPLQELDCSETHWDKASVRITQ